MNTEMVIVIAQSCYEGGYQIEAVFHMPADVDKYLSAASESELNDIEISVWDTSSGSYLADIEHYSMVPHEGCPGFKREYDLNFSKRYFEWLDTQVGQ